MHSKLLSISILKFSFKQVDVTPPEGKSKDCLLCLVIKDGELKLCAEDADDMRYSVTYLFMITKLINKNASYSILNSEYMYMCQ